MRPMLAENYVETKLVLPCGIQPKIDGVRGLNMYGQFTGRSMKPPKNRFTVKRFSQPQFRGLDGEMALGDPQADDLCRRTSSVLNTIDGEPGLHWWAFDLVLVDTIHLGYQERYRQLCEFNQYLRDTDDIASQWIRVVPMSIARTLNDVRELHQLYTEQGYEGTIIRSLTAKHKQGRSTVREGGLLRIKDYTEEEAVVRRVIEGQENQNEATINELGLTERAGKQENMVPNGMVGALECWDIKTEKLITVSAGKLTHAERLAYFQNPEPIVGKTIKYKLFTKGIKDKPRHPTFQCIRAEEDM